MLPGSFLGRSKSDSSARKVASIPFRVSRRRRFLLLDGTIGEQLVPGSTDFEIRLPPAALKGHAWVQNGQRNDGQKNHHAFEDHEADLLVCQFAVEPFLELGDSVAGSDEDEQR